MTEYEPTDAEDRQVVDTFVKAATAREHSPHAIDFGGWLACQLAEAAARLGSVERLLRSRPGSWEAGLIGNLVWGAVGYCDEYLPVVDEADRVPEVIPGAMGTGNVLGDDGETLQFADEGDWVPEGHRVTAAGLHCPGCGQHAAMRIRGGQAFCANDDCAILMWDPEQTPEELAGNLTVVDLRGKFSGEY